jgi:sensor histidine kinase YesM
MEKFLAELVLSNNFSYRIGRHLLFWSMCVLFFGTIYGSYWDAGIPVKPYAFVDAIIYLPLHMFLSYSIIYFLFPHYLFKGRYLSLIAGILILITVTAFLSFFVAKYLITPFHHAIDVPAPKHTLFSGFMAGLRGSNTVAGFAVAIKLVKYWYLKNLENTQLEKEKLKAELEVLKGQLQPHFLFNTLNNLYSLILQQSRQAPEVVLKLSELLRYILEESSNTKIPLTKEISIIKSYIALEQIRFEKRLEISLNIDGDLEDILIEPLLFLPLVENAFKHGANEMLEQAWMSLDISANERELHFKLINGKSLVASPAASVSTGIGLQNLRKRLALTYPEKHTLKIVDDEDKYMVNLQLQV